MSPTLEKQDEAILIHDSPPMAPPLVYMKDKLDDAVSTLHSARLNSNFSIMAGVLYILMTRFHLLGCFFHIYLKKILTLPIYVILSCCASR